MFKIVRFPKRLEPFFESLLDRFHWDHHSYFKMLVLLTAFSWGRRNICNLYRHLDEEGNHHRSRFNNFMLVSRWNQEEALRTKARELLAALGVRSGDTVNFILDDSKKEKRGGKRKNKQAKNRTKAQGAMSERGRKRTGHDKTMQGVGWIHDPVSGRNVRGHQYVTAVIEFNGVVIPFGVRLYVKKELAGEVGVEFKKVTQLAAELIDSFDPPDGVQVIVEFDSYYLCPVVAKACRRKKFHFVSTLKNNRNLFKNGRKLKAGKYGKNIFRQNKKKTTLCLPKGDRVKRYRYVDCGRLEISKLGTVHLVYSSRSRHRSVVAIVTDHPKLSAKQMIIRYDARWNIEVFFKETKQLLGLGQYQNGTYSAAVTHLHLVCFAYALLTHIAIEREGAKGKKRKRKSAASMSTAERQNELRRIVWDDLTKYLKGFPTGTKVIKELERLLAA